MQKPSRVKPFKILLSIVIVILILSVAFIKFDTAGAALFTDNYLRPILGNNIVGFLEKSYFNTADKIQQVTYNGGTSNQPKFNPGGGKITGTPIPINNGLSDVAGEGIWHSIPLPIFPNESVIDYTFVRPDPTRPYAYVTLAQMDMSKLKLGTVAGKSQPGGPVGNSGPGVIPEDVVKSGKLVAAFNGGFQYRDGKYGMIVGGKTYLPLENDIGTLVGYNDGTLQIVRYTGQDFGQNVAFIRQNCPILIENGQIFALNEEDKKLWGRTFNADIFTWRSGVGLTANGNLIYAVGNNLSPQTLAEALKMAGAVNAIQLDINPFWVRFNIFRPTGAGTYKSITLTKDLKDGSTSYLNGYGKDFFYVYAK